MNIAYKRCIIAIAAIITLCSCNKIKDKTAETITGFISDNELYYTSIQYRYEYDGDKLISETSIHSQIMLGQVMDSSVFIRLNKYNEKGLLYETRAFHENELYDLSEYLYNSNDSLICEYSISEDGDTTSFYEYGYFPDGQQIVFSRRIFANLPDYLNTDDDLFTFAEVIQTKADTMLYWHEYLYEDTLCVERKRYDKDYNLVDVVEYIYHDGVIAEEKHYSYFGSSKVFDKTVKYDYSKSKLYPNELHTDIVGNIVEYKVHQFNDTGELVASKHSTNNDDNVEIVYYENGREIGFLSSNKEYNYEIKESISYYENGDVKEIRTSTKDYQK